MMKTDNLHGEAGMSVSRIPIAEEDLDMELIKKPCDEKALDSSIFFQRVWNGSAGLITEKDKNAASQQLWALMHKQTRRYTMDDSSSITVEKASELYNSVSYCIGMQLKEYGSNAAEQLRTQSAESLFDMGQALVKKAVSEGKALLNTLQNEFVDIKNISYHDTVFNALPGFFVSYDPRFFAHETPCDIDYQLFIGVKDFKGIEYINEYLKRLLIENGFLKSFEPKHIELLLQGYCPEPEQQLINIFEPVLINSVGLKLIGKEVRGLDITEVDRAELLNRFCDNEGEKLFGVVSNAVNGVLEDFNISGSEAAAYIKEIEKPLTLHFQRMLNEGELSALFISFASKAEAEIVFKDNMHMPDEQLRKLIDEMKTCRFTTDKLMILSRVRSVSDWVELVNECFFEDEYEQVFKNMGKDESSVLCVYLRDNSRNVPWEGAFLKFTFGQNK